MSTQNSVVPMTMAHRSVPPRAHVLTPTAATAASAGLAGPMARLRRWWGGHVAELTPRDQYMTRDPGLAATRPFLSTR
jgi:hypothetical protein